MLHPGSRAFGLSPMGPEGTPKYSLVPRLIFHQVCGSECLEWPGLSLIVFRHLVFGEWKNGVLYPGRLWSPKLARGRRYWWERPFECEAYSC